MNLDSNASNYNNDANVEQAWALKAFHHAETFFNLISSLDSQILKLTKEDDLIYAHFRQSFPDMKVDVITEEQLKSEDSKKKWREFCTKFEGVVEDYNFGTLLRLNCKGDYNEENSILVTRIQFYAIEIARNKEGLNLDVWKRKRTVNQEEKVSDDVKQEDSSPS